MGTAKALRTQEDTDYIQTAIHIPHHTATLLMHHSEAAYEEMFHREVEQKFSEDN